MPVAASGFLDLPTEILSAIFENPALPAHTLHSLSLVCRRLHLVALPSYIARHVDAESNLTTTLQSNGRDLLATLQSALFVPQVTRITCVFPHPCCTSIVPLLPHLRRLQTFITRLPAVEHVTLVLDASNSADMCLSVGDDKGLEAWAAHLEALLNCIVRKHCKSLALVHGGQFTSAYELRPLPLPSRRAQLLAPVQQLLSLCRKTTSMDFEIAFRRDPRQGLIRIGIDMPPAVASAAQLAFIDIQSSILLVPPGLQWTLTALRCARITSLSLNLGVLKASVWSAVAPLLASASLYLTSLVLLEAGFVHESDLFPFLAQLPRLTSLTLAAIMTPPIRRGGNLALPALRTLRAPPNFINHLLRTPAGLPALEALCVQWAFTHTASLTARLGPHLARITAALDRHGRAPTLTVALHHRIAFYGGLAPPPASADGALDLRCLTRVAALEIRATPFAGEPVAEISLWIACFPRVQRVDVRWVDGAPPEPAEVDALVQQTRATEFLDRISVDGRIYYI
ncbi:hypothetical protein B0H15DRAFT_832950 [Mycena belliarum]|uniref:F-box domain-containing protein n=1 Tax=Mycena belliarum TaxID=1033014 RepID=A0AAD6UBQ8_9AGAR|nr:hypothetical protein B0H15DRAFT_832950 [Mycena belliae]